MNSNDTVKVWDPLVRIGHWTLVAGFFIAFMVGDDILWLHRYAGYLTVAIVALRIPWGIVGTRYARFTNFVYRPRTVIAYLKDVAAFRPKRYLGHNPAGGAMIIALLLLIPLLTLTGMAAETIKDGSGPLAVYTVGGTPLWLKALALPHELLTNLAMAMVIAHIVGVLITSLQHRENLVRAMITGRKPAPRQPIAPSTIIEGAKSAASDHHCGD